MYSLFSSAWGFALGYLCLMIPTYILPYFGSNSVIVGAIGAVVGRGLTPQWWMHAWCLVMLVLMASVRGKSNGRTYLMVFPIIGGLFDLTPFLSFIPFVPTVMHLCALVLGFISRATETQTATDEAGGEPIETVGGVWENWTAGGFSALAIVGCLWFVASARQPVRPAVPSFSTVETDTKPAPGKKIEPSAAPPSAAVTPANINPSGSTPSTRPAKQRPTTGNASNPAPLSQKKSPDEAKPEVRYIDINK